MLGRYPVAGAPVAGGRTLFGAFSPTLGAGLLAGTGLVAISGSSAKSLAGVGQSSAGAVAVSGALAAVLAPARQSGGAATAISGAGAAVISDVGYAGAASVPVRGDAAAALARIALTGAGHGGFQPLYDPPDSWTAARLDAAGWTTPATTPNLWSPI